MNANELLSGNFVTMNSTLEIVQNINKNDNDDEPIELFNGEKCKASDIEPIILDNGILEDYGFTSNESTYAKGSIKLQLLDDHCYKIVSDKPSQFPIKNVKYLHCLQNVISSLHSDEDPFSQKQIDLLCRQCFFRYINNNPTLHVQGENISFKIPSSSWLHLFTIETHPASIKLFLQKEKICHTWILIRCQILKKDSDGNYISINIETKLQIVITLKKYVPSAEILEPIYFSYTHDS